VSPAEHAHRVRQNTGLRLDTTTANAFLEDWRDRGIAEERLGRWRLTETGRAMFGAYVPNLDLIDNREVAGA
jgi:hypothetical protein